jgi:sulfatase maturation enzyme AslB (radical SAM superfamily)
MPKFNIFSSSESRDLSKTKAVTLTVTEDCNLRCRYCYEPTKSRDRYMSLDLAKKIVSEQLDADNDLEWIEFDFFGGEPMLAFDLIRDLVDWVHSRQWKKRHLFFIGTNGTILTEEMKDWLTKYKQCVWASISLDGNKIAHDLNRSNSYDSVRRNLRFFVDTWPLQPVKMTISAETIPYVADSVIELEEMEVPFSVNLVFEDIWGPPEQKSKLLKIYAEQLDRLVEYYVAHPDLYPARIVDMKPEYTAPEWFSGQDGEDACVRYCGASTWMEALHLVIVSLPGLLANLPRTDL